MRTFIYSLVIGVMLLPCFAGQAVAESCRASALCFCICKNGSGESIGYVGVDGGTCVKGSYKCGKCCANAIQLKLLAEKCIDASYMTKSGESKCETYCGTNEVKKVCAQDDCNSAACK